MFSIAGVEEYGANPMVSYLGVFVLTQTLMHLLKETANLPGADVRIAVVRTYHEPSRQRDDN